MTIEYTYAIEMVDKQAGCMEVVYTASGRSTHRISTRIPFEGESLETVIAMYSPIAIWEAETQTLADVQVGTGGVITPPPMPDLQEFKNFEMWQQVDFERRLAKALIKFGVLQSDPTAIEVTQL